jgi:hypothetical protein
MTSGSGESCSILADSTAGDVSEEPTREREKVNLSKEPKMLPFLPFSCFALRQVAVARTIQQPLTRYIGIVSGVVFQHAAKVLGPCLGLKPALKF